MLEDLSTPLLDAANAKLANPSLNCADIGSGIAAFYTAAAAGGEEAAVDTKYYPHRDSGTCLSDGLQPSWMSRTEIFNNVHDCCKNNFPWNTDCVAQSTPVTGVIFYPDTDSYYCKADGRQPPYMAKDQLFNNEEDCCKFNFSWLTVEDCVSTAAAPTTATSTTASTTTAGTTTSTTRASTTTAAKANADQPIPYDQSTLFFPLFESGITKCKNEGTPTSWLSLTDFKDTLSGCCRSYASNYDDCMTASTVTNQRYYPDFQTMSCLSEEEGTPGDWMTNDYFRWNEKRCCKSFFATAQSSSCSDLL